MMRVALSVLFFFLACPVVQAQDTASHIFDVSKPHTVNEWSLFLKGKLNRSAIVKLLGTPDVAMTGSLTFNNRVKDPDTDELYALHLMFLQGEHLPATYVGYLPNHVPSNAPPFDK